MNWIRSTWIPYVAVIYFAWLWLVAFPGGLIAFNQADRFQWFESKIRPALHTYCLECHHQGKSNGSLALDSRMGWIIGGDSGAAILPGDPQGSLLYRAMAHLESGLEMPSKGPKVPADVLKAFEVWILDGAPDPRDEPEGFDEQGTSNWDAQVVERSKWWAWKPPVEHGKRRSGEVESSDAGSEAKDGIWIDKWIDQSLKEKGIAASQIADSVSLIRRLSFTLRGLPPTIEEVRDYAPRLANTATHEMAWRELVDRMLDSREYAEHWGRHWLDIVRYAETHGSEDDAYLPFAYRYRDYVIRAFERDVPLDRLIQEHIAGDLIAPRIDSQLGFNEALIGVCFYRLVEFNQTPVDVKREEIAVIDSQIDAMSKAFQGLTISCARCHDHKFDPISDEDYYALYGVLRSTRAAMLPLEDSEKTKLLFSDVEQEQASLGVATLKNNVRQVPQWKEAVTKAVLWVRSQSQEGTKWEERKWEEIASTLPEDRWTRLLARWKWRPKEAPSEALAQWLFAFDSPIADQQVLRAAVGKEQAERQSQWMSLLQTSNAGGGLGDIKDLDRLSGTEARSRNGMKLLFDLDRDEFQGWRVSGYGMPEEVIGVEELAYGRDAGQSDVLPTRWSVLGQSTSPLVRLLEGGYHSNMVSDRASGSLRSPDFVIDTDQISMFCRGTADARARLVIENFQGDSLLFSTLNPALSTDAPRWVTMHIRPQWKGLRAHIEFLTRDAKPYLGVIKDPAVLERSDGRSSFGVHLVVGHASGERLPIPARVIEDWLSVEDPNADGLDRFLGSIQGSLERLLEGSGSVRDARWINLWIDSGVFASLEDNRSEGLEAVANYKSEESKIPIPRWIPGVVEDRLAVEQAWLPRGDHKRPEGSVPRRYLEILDSQASQYAGAESGRLQLALEITDQGNPLTARVMANRIWYWLVGEGLVSTVDNFGRMGDEPSHPELLDELALELIDKKWSTKELIRRIVRTRFWRRSSAASESSIKIDPANRFLSHANLRRLEAESIRDSMVWVTGQLRRPDGGLATRNYYKTVMEPNKQSPPGPIDGEMRRSIYLEVRRNFPDEFLMVFDQPKPASTVGKRYVTNGPAQSLMMLNDAMVIGLAERWSKRISGTTSDTQARVVRMFEEWLSRAPTPEEISDALQVIQGLEAQVGEERAWANFALALFNTKEGMFVR
jgi:hypothetical protein